MQDEVTLCGGSVYHQVLVEVTAKDRDGVPPIAPVRHVVESERLQDCLGPDTHDAPFLHKLCGLGLVDSNDPPVTEYKR